jgi:hypothetical protein
MKNKIAKIVGLMAATVLSLSVFALPAQKAAEADAAPAATGTYISELTGLPISAALQNQRPVAIMVDNEKTALPHYGLNQADIVYEMMNSTANGRITRLMAIVKDYASITQFGNVRSTRPTNVILASEYNAILIHDGGPYYINQFLADPASNNLSGGFARFSNGKRSEFTEYVTYNSYTNPKTGKTYSGLAQRLAASGYSTTYNQYYMGSGLKFAAAEFNLGAGATSATSVSLPFPHNSSALYYNAGTGTYDYSEYGKAHNDALTNQRTTFENVLILNCDFVQLDNHGYMAYYILGGNVGYYLTNGKAIPISWAKAAANYPTVYTDATTGQPLTLNPGKTYIAIVPSDVWTSLAIK